MAAAELVPTALEGLAGALLGEMAQAECLQDAPLLGSGVGEGEMPAATALVGEDVEAAGLECLVDAIDGVRDVGLAQLQLQPAVEEQGQDAEGDVMLSL